ncbi:MAG: HAD family hydrolase [Phycisphaerales bacterium]|nr:HAD family hydrolase [Phycisphaerales bacterium]
MYVIFDMDDTLVATADLWRDAEMHLLANLLPLSPRSI